MFGIHHLCLFAVVIILIHWKQNIFVFCTVHTWTLDLIIKYLLRKKLLVSFYRPISTNPYEQSVQAFGLLVALLVALSTYVYTINHILLHYLLQ